MKKDYQEIAKSISYLKEQNSLRDNFKVGSQVLKNVQTQGDPYALGRLLRDIGQSNLVQRAINRRSNIMKQVNRSTGITR